MCGISGLVLRSGEKVDPAQLDKMAQSMIRRGPDAQGVFARENVGLAHRRLKIIDLSDDANQPLFNEDGRVGVVFNGEIYNFRAMRSELVELGHRFKSKSDTEVLVHAFEEWGPKLFKRLDGMFAFAIWDNRGPSPVVYLVRDRFGIKPLFYSHRLGRLAFASELKPLLEVPWIGRSVEAQTLFYFLKFSHVPTPDSILEGVRQMTPGTWLEVKDGQLTENTYWDPKVLSTERPKIFNNEKSAIDELDRILKRVVDHQMVSDVPLGCFLSGGIDSSLLAIYASALREEKGAGSKLQTFTLGYAESEFDETPHARKLARGFKTEHHEILARPSDFFSLIPDLPVYFDQPFADPTLLSSLLLARFAREHVTVALSGDGGDELFFGYSQQRALLFLRQLDKIPSSIRSPFFNGIGKLSRLFDHVPRGQQIAKLAEILQFKTEAELYQYFVGTIGPMRMDRIAGLLEAKVDPYVSHWDKMFQSLADLKSSDVIAQVFIRTFLVDTVLAKTDRAGMAFGLEARVPFLDDEMGEFSARLSFSHKQRSFPPMTSKYLLRQLLKRKLRERGLDESLSRRPKQGFSIPMRDWLRGELKYLLDEYLNVARIRREGIFNPARIHVLVKSHVDCRANHSHLLWSLLSFQMWRERWGA